MSYSHSYVLKEDEDEGEDEVIILSLGSSMMDAQTPDHVSRNPPPSVEDSPAGKVLPETQSSSFSASASNAPLDDDEGVSADSCLVSVDHFCYMNHIYKKEIRQIEKKNKSNMVAYVNVTFEADQTDGRPNEALSDFTKLIQNHSVESRCSLVPLKFVAPDQWSEAMKVIQKNHNKLFLTLSSEEVVVRGPSQSREAFSGTLNADQKTNMPSKETQPAAENTSQRADMSTREPLFKAEVLKKGYYNKTSPRDRSVSSTKRSGVKESYRHSGDFSCLKAPTLVHRDTLASLSTELYEVTGFSGSQHKNPNIRPSSSKQTTQNSDASKPWNSKDEICPICLDPFINKKQLKCKHEFCEECLQESKKIHGPICPICKDVFGVMEGNQPDGTMTWTTHPTPLPGFPHCSHILISYNIPSGKQSDKHPNPGQPYYGTVRLAYLPNNTDGNEVLKLLKKAFDQKLIFTVGMSRTTGMEDVVTWNDIPHKTSLSGGAQSYGYPDPNYLIRVKEALKAKGIM